MKHILRLFVLFSLLGIAMPDASAQVSVRRGGSRTESSSRRKDKEKKSEKKSESREEAKPTAPPITPRSERTETIEQRDEQRPVVRQEAPVNRVDPAGSATATRRVTPKKQQQQTVVDGATQRQQSFDEYQRQEDSYIPWQHVVYRELDLTKGSNASLYYPIEPQDGLTNMFRVILDGLCTGKVKGYEYLDGREVFDEKYVVKVQDILDKFQILYQQRPGIGQHATTQYVVEEMDVPSNEVLSYYIKERWEFNLKNSKYGPRILAICPVLHRAGDFGGDAVRYPMCWLNYEDLRPLLREHLIMSDGMNNTPRFTMEEFFTLEQYEGDIYKVQNTRGLSLMQQYPDPDTLKVMQAKIEAELRGFGDSIWIHEPTDAELAAQDSIRAAQRAERRAHRKGGDSASADTGTKRNRRTKEAVDMDAVADAQEAKEDEIDQRIEQTGKAHSAKRSARRR